MSKILTLETELLLLSDRYAVRFIPRENGMYYIYVRLNSNHIPGSPFRVLVGKRDADPGLVRVYGDGLSKGKTGMSHQCVHPCRGTGKMPCHLVSLILFSRNMCCS